jgi:hypothetical protein
MSTEIINALSCGDITPAQFWIRHIGAWTLIADATPLADTDEMYRELADAASDLGEFFTQVA